MEKAKPDYCPFCGEKAIKNTPIPDAYLCLSCGKWFTVLCMEKNVKELSKEQREYLLGVYDPPFRRKLKSVEGM